MRLRYEAEQVVDALGRARGEGRHALLMALTRLLDDRREEALAQALRMDLAADEQMIVLTTLARSRPSAYLSDLVDTGLRSRSIGAQQMTIAALPDLAGRGLSPDLSQKLEAWLRRRLKNPRRVTSWATWEVPGVALALLPSYGIERTIDLLRAVEPYMQAEEQTRWRALERRSGDLNTFEAGLHEWCSETIGGPIESQPRDPTAEVYVDRVMKRLGYSPANPQSPLYDDLADFDVPMYEMDLGSTPD